VQSLQHRLKTRPNVSSRLCLKRIEPQALQSWGGPQAQRSSNSAYDYISRM